jgi:hypothetical protein
MACARPTRTTQDEIGGEQSQSDAQDTDRCEIMPGTQTQRADKQPFSTNDEITKGTSGRLTTMSGRIVYPQAMVTFKITVTANLQPCSEQIRSMDLPLSRNLSVFNCNFGLKSFIGTMLY